MLRECLRPFAPDSRYYGITGIYQTNRWKWGGGQASGKVADIVEEGKAQVTSNKVSFGTKCVLVNSWTLTSLTVVSQGNTITRNAKEGDPAVKISRDGVSIGPPLCCLIARPTDWPV